MPDIQRNAQSITTTSATTAPAAGTSETWTVTALAAGIRTLTAGETYALVDATSGASAAQQAEIVRVTAATAGGTSITVVRGADGTTPVAHANPSTFNIVVVAASIPLNDWPDYAAAPEDYQLKNKYDKLRGVYNYKSSNTRRMEQGLSLAMAGGMTEQIVIGDSGSTGANSSVGVVSFDRLRAWPLAMRDQLAALGIPSGGTGYVRVLDGNYQDTRWTNISGTWSGQTFYSIASTVGATATFNPERAGNTLDVWWYGGTSSTATVSINGASSGNGFATIASGATTGWFKTRLSGVDIRPNAAIKITVTVAGSGFYFGGFSVFTPNGGLIIHNMAQGGARAGGTADAYSWTNLAANGLGTLVYNGTSQVGQAGKRRTVTDAASTAGSPNLTSATATFTSTDVGTPLDFVPGNGGIMWEPNKHYFIGAYTNSTTVVVHTMVNGVSTPVNAALTLSAQTLYIGRDPSCVHIELGLNDLNSGQTPAQVVADITTIRSWFPNSDCILHLVHEMNYGFVPQATQRAFWQAMYKLADTLDVPLYDWRDRVGAYTDGMALGAYGDNQVHLTPAINADLGAQLAFVMGGGSGSPQSNNNPVYPHDLINRRWTEDTYGRSTKVVPGTTATTTVEAVVAKVFVPANTLKVGSIIKYALWASSGATATVVTTRLRIGTTGTTSDASVISMSASASTAGARYMEGIDAIQVVGASATHIGGGTSTIGSATAAGTAVAATSNFDSTKDNWVSVTLQNTTSATTTVYAGELEVTV